MKIKAIFTVIAFAVAAYADAASIGNINGIGNINNVNANNINKNTRFNENNVDGLKPSSNQPNDSKANAGIKIQVTKVSRQLVENWIKVYKSVRPDVNIEIVDKGEDANIAIVNDAAHGAVTNVARYAILPVTSVENPLYNEISHKQWSEKDLKKLFFQTEDDLLDDADSKSKKEKLSDKLTVISGNNSASASAAFAKHFGFKKGDIRGKRIAGDDKFLLNAIQKDQQSVTFNNLAYLYDLTSRQLKQNISVLPLDVKKEQANVLESGNLDEIIKLVESSEIETIPVENIAFSLNVFNSDVDNFLSWVVTDGQQYNNKSGFLKLDPKDAKQQLALLTQK